MIKIYCNDNLKDVLDDNDVEEYVPAYGGESAGLDLYNAGSDITIMPSSSNKKGGMISTGLHVFTPRGYVTLFKERGSITKTPLKYRAGVVDEGYTGEIFVNLHNVGTTAQFIEPGQKIAQGVFVRIEKPILWEIGEDSIYGTETSRGSGALGSTGDS